MGMSKLPKRFTRFVETYPDVGEAYMRLGQAVSEAGPLDPRSRELVKLGVALGAGQEGGVHSHARKALEAGVTRAELRHAAMQALTTIGFPNMMRGLTWIEDVLERLDNAEPNGVPES